MDWNSVKIFLTELVTSFGLKLVGGILVLVVGMRLIKWVGKKLRTSPRLDRLEPGVRTFISSFSSIALYIVLALTVAVILGIPTASFVAALASACAAVGLALQGALSNFAGGIMILMFKPFQVGDYISTPGAEGTVSDITVVYTVLHTLDNRTVTIPNGTLTNSVIENYTAQDKRRIDFSFEVAYDSDMEQVKESLLSVARAHPLVLQDPQPLARLDRNRESSMSYAFQVWCRPQDFWTVKYDMAEQVKKEFDRCSIRIPYPQVQVHLDGDR